MQGAADSPSGDKAFHRYWFFGAVLGSRVRLESLASADTQACDVTLVRSAAVAPKREGVRVQRAGSAISSDGRPVLTLRVYRDALELLVSGFGRFAITRREICYYCDTPSAEQYLELYLVPALALWREFTGLPVLHAGSISINGRSACLLAKSGAGKSTLVAACAASGAEVISDDVVAIGFNRAGWQALPGPVGIRLRPSEFNPLQPFCPPSTNELTGKWHLTSGIPFARRPAQLGVIYLYERSRSVQRFLSEDLSAPEALMALVRSGFCGRFTHLVAPPARLTLLASLTRAVPIRRLVGPDDLAALPEICRFLADELGKTSASRPVRKSLT